MLDGKYIHLLLQEEDCLENCYAEFMGFITRVSDFMTRDEVRKCLNFTLALFSYLSEQSYQLTLEDLYMIELEPLGDICELLHMLMELVCDIDENVRNRGDGLKPELESVFVYICVEFEIDYMKFIEEYKF